jgi:hypothetical protein
VAVLLALAVVVGGIAFAVNRFSGPRPGCTVTAKAQASSAADAPEFRLNFAQADNAATIAAVGKQLGMPDHAVTVALATALQESDLANLSGGDRDSAGLFQQRPSQGWGSYAEVTDPVHAARAFYHALAEIPGWRSMPVADAAQAVQHSGAPGAYAQWEFEARAVASALTGETHAALSCAAVPINPPGDDLVQAAQAELGTAELSGSHGAKRGWLLASWLVAHSRRFALEQVSFNGMTWTADSGTWKHTGPADGVLSLQRATAAAGGGQ